MSKEKTEEQRPCYLCDRYVASKVVSGVPICALCDFQHIEPHRQKRKEAEKKEKAPPKKDAPKDEADPVFDLDWDEGELDTQPGWGGFIGIKP